MAPIQIVLCGKSSNVVVGVKEGIRPAYEVMHVVNSVDAGVRDLPLLLQRQAPPSKDWANLGTQQYEQKVGAVVAGAGYNDADFAQMREACKGMSNIPWLRHDLSNDFDPSQPKPKVGIEYGDLLAKNIVDRLKILRREGKMECDGVYWFQGKDLRTRPAQ